ncbi:glycoside hydrolase family 97 protein [Chitinophaga sp. 30R24]|uniref:glycoside hydrolase family 97 protein n=1 Tax=Chitinophaga sp. 30R24 TaxID=3248838 RepID=UPI003B90017A
MICRNICTFLLLLAMQQGSAQELTAQQDKTKLIFSLDHQGTPQYAVYLGEKTIVKPSSMGFVLQEDSTFYKGFKILGSEKKDIDETWNPVWGEVSHIRNHYEQLTVHLQRNIRLLDIVFRVFADGVGFRYEFPQQPSLDYFVVKEERTAFAMAGDHTAFWIPGDYDTNEYEYTTSKLSAIDNRNIVASSTAIAVRVAPDAQAVQTPLMLKTNDGLYINLHEAALVNYAAMQLHVDRQQLVFSSHLVPDAVGNAAYMHTPCQTPWRTVIVSDKATDILSSKMILNLNDPSAIVQTDWIKPMKYVGIWWEMQTGKSTWSYATDERHTAPSGQHGATTANVKRYIDFAAANQIPGVLIEGWNTGWESWFGNWKENVFDFVTPYPDFDVAGLQQYAANKGVQLIMHNETSGAAADYDRQLDTAFRFMTRYGYPAVKTGYVGKIIPRGEHHDGQWMINHYQRVVAKAAQYHIMVDAHEPARPTGLQRTWPNWMACEASRGNEYNAFANGNRPEHETILPFTRLIGGPMDYTPGIFKLSGYGADTSKRVHTTLAKQLALYVTLYSPLQMAADLPENYALYPDAFRFIREVPVDWDDTRILAAEPGDYISIARKGKGSNNWYLGAITDENSRNLETSLSFLDEGKQYLVTLYADAPGADWYSNPEAYTIRSFIANSHTILQLKLANGGGAALTMVPATAQDLKMVKPYHK